MKCDVIDGSVVNGLRQPILYSFAFDKKLGYKVFSEPETIHYKKINKSVLKSPKPALSTLPELITFCNTGKGHSLGKFV